MLRFAPRVWCKLVALKFEQAETETLHQHHDWVLLVPRCRSLIGPACSRLGAEIVNVLSAVCSHTFLIQPIQI